MSFSPRPPSCLLFLLGRIHCRDLASLRRPELVCRTPRFNDSTRASSVVLYSSDRLTTPRGFCACLTRRYTFRYFVSVAVIHLSYSSRKYKIAETDEPSMWTTDRRGVEMNGPMGLHESAGVQVPELDKSSVWMKDRRRVQEIIESMRQAGSSSLQVVSDFDMTLTRFACNGMRCPTCHNILEDSMLISEECKKLLKELLKKYYPVEIHTLLTAEEKLPHMVDWWTKAHNLLIQQKIRKDQLALAVKESNVMLREEYNSFFDRLLEKNIPLVIFSAGIGDILEEVIRQAGVFHSNIMVFSNYMDFDAMGTLQAFKGKLIHTFNKNGDTLVKSEHFEKLQDRHNVILLGDSEGDLTMVEGLPDVENILRIGFLNDKVEERRESYMNYYDIVLEKDETLDVPNAILLYVTAQQ